MLIKLADDQSKRLALLESLEQSPLLDDRQKKWLRDELWKLRKGRSGERNAAYYIDSALKDNPNLAVIHDLRLEWEDESAQIDHLIISRGLIFYLLETKNFSGNLSINEHGEFTVFYGNTRQGIPSPIQQSKRHEKVLTKWLEQLGISGRFGSSPQFFHVVLVAPTSTINRPTPAKFDTSNVIKADAFDAWRLQHVENRMSFGQTFTAMANLRSADTVREWAQKLVDMHRPLNPLQLPDFMKPREQANVQPQAQAAARSQPVKSPRPAAQRVSTAAAPGAVCASCAKPLSAAEQAFCSNNAKLFDGAMLCMTHQKTHREEKQREQANDAIEPKQHQTPLISTNTENVAETDPRKGKRICCTCDKPISFAEGKFCWSNERRFGGLQYCREHQHNLHKQ